MASKGKRKGDTTSPFDLEALGLVLLAFGIFSGGLLVPALPTGEFGDMLRAGLVERIGLGSYLLPWPLLLLGSLFLLRKSPRSWPRLLAGYLITGLGAWLLAAQLQPALTGSWGEALRARGGGAVGVAGYLGSALIISLGLERIFALPPTAIARALLRAVVQTIRGTAKAIWAWRLKARAKAAFSADVALTRSALKEIDRDLAALRSLYPGSTELDKWRQAVGRTLSTLRRPDPAKLADAEADVRAWRDAVYAFTQDRAGELRQLLRAEGLEDFDTWARGSEAQLDEPVGGEIRSAVKLDAIRNTLLLDLTALAERYRRLTRERDLAEHALSDTTPHLLIKAYQAHHLRSAQYKSVTAAARDLTRDAHSLEDWRSLLDDLNALHQSHPESGRLHEFDEALAAELESKGREALSQMDGWRHALSTVREELTRTEVEAAEPGQEFEEAAWEHGAAESGAGSAETAADLAPSDIPADVPPAAAEQGALLEVRDADLTPDGGGIPIQRPDLDLLDPAVTGDDDPVAQAREGRERVAKIDETLANFKLQGRVVASVRGPTVTRFEVEPAPGEKISRFAGLSDDLALAMAVGSVRIEAPIPGKSVIGLEVPNAKRELITFREAAEAPGFRRSRERLPLILGKSIDGEMIVADLAKMPHLLIAGSTGSGKSVAVSAIIGSLLFKFLPTELRLLMIDPKMVELTPFDGIPHLLRPVVTNPNDAAGVLLGTVAHMERRYKMMSKIGAKNLDQYNEKARNLDLPVLPFVAVVIDELADLMITSPKEVESAVMRLAQMARATGMHLILATQRPSVDILTSLIKVNVPARMAFAVSSGHDSRTILDTMGAERLIGYGDMLYYQPGLVKPVRLQGPLVSESEISALAGFLRRQYFDDDFVEAYGADFDPPPLDDSSASGLVDWHDDKLRDAAELVINEGQASVSRLQRRLQVGHARAGKLMDSLEALGVVGAHVGSKPREVLVTIDDLPSIFGR